MPSHAYKKDYTGHTWKEPTFTKDEQRTETKDDYRSEVPISFTYGLNTMPVIITILCPNLQEKLDAPSI